MSQNVRVEQGHLDPSRSRFRWVYRTPNLRFPSSRQQFTRHNRCSPGTGSNQGGSPLTIVLLSHRNSRPYLVTEAPGAVLVKTDSPLMVIAKRLFDYTK
jgi:hypothetical protein